MIPTYSTRTLKRFLAVEGLDGAGTSTQAERLGRNLQGAGMAVSLSCEPTPGPVGTLIKQIMRGRLVSARDRGETERQLAYLFAADRFDHLYNKVDGVAGQVEQGFTVISTRYHFSSYAYNARTAADFDLIDRLNRDFPLPELVVFVRVPVKTSMERLDERPFREFYEREEELRRVAENFDRILAPIRDRVIEVDGSRPVEAASGELCAAVLSRLSSV